MSSQIPTKDIVIEFLNSEMYKDNLIYIEEYASFFMWQDGWYEEVDKRDINRMCLDFVDLMFPKQAISKMFFENFYSIATLRCKQIYKKQKIGGYISFNDKLLDTNTFEIIEKDRKYICLHTIPYNLMDIDKPIPTFKKFLESSLVQKDNNKLPDEELIMLVQEMMGFFLMDSMKGAAAFFLVGEGSNGKSTLLKVVEEIIGERFINAMSIQALTTNIFNPPALIGKRINISNEEESKYMEAAMFKALVTGERISGQRKFGDVIQFVPKTKFVFATNELPTFKSMNHALKRRLKIIPFYRIIQDKDQDKELNEKLSKEIPGIIGWAIEGAKRFIENKQIFSNSVASEERMIEFENETSAALRFVRDRYKVSETAFITNSDLYNAYKEWCKETGRNHKNNHNFSQDLVRNIKGIENVRRRGDGNKVIRGKNLELSDEVDTYEEEDEKLDVNNMDFTR